MPNASANVELRLRFADGGATSGIDRAARHIRQTTQATENAVNQSNNRQRSSYERLSHARETLGVRSEHRVQREIQQTQAAYNRLERSGTVSQAALSRAADRTAQRIARLTNEIGRQTSAQQRATREAENYERTMSRIRLGAAAGAGVLAAGYMLKAPVTTAMSFDERLALMANTAFKERDAKGRLLGAKQLEATINQSTDLKRGGAGTREQAAEALDLMIARDTLGFEKSMAFLPAVMRTAYGTGANPVDIANLSSVLYGQGIVKDDKSLKIALNMATAAGQAGGFEIKDMARWLPQQLPLAQASGLTGLAGLQKVLTMNQAAILTSGTTDEAGNNVRNLLTKLSSKDTANDFKKAGRGDLGKFLIDQRIKGVDAVDAWMNLIDQEAEKSPTLKNAMARLKGATTKGDQQAAIDAITQLSEGNVIGQYFQDMQARGALFALRNKELTGRVGPYISKNMTEFGANDINFQTVSGTGAAAMRNAEQELAIKQKDAMEKLIPTITKAADMFVDLSQKYPDLSAAVVGATPPIVAMGAAAGITAASMGGLGGSLGALAGGVGGVLKVLGSFSAGYGVGTALDKGVEMATGKKASTWIGSAAYDFFNTPASMKLPDAEPRKDSHVVLHLPPGVEVKKQWGKTVKVETATGNVHTGAP